MPITIDYLTEHQVNYASCQNFIETGLLYGETTLKLEPHFQRVVSVEIKQEFIDAVKANNDTGKIEFVQGDTALVLGPTVQGVQGKTLFYLDAHWNGEDTGRGLKSVPLYEELEAIKQNHTGEAIILINCVPCFGSDVYQWEDINYEKLMETIGSRATNNFYLSSPLHQKERLVIEISAL